MEGELGLKTVSEDGIDFVSLWELQRHSVIGFVVV